MFGTRIPGKRETAVSLPTPVPKPRKNRSLATNKTRAHTATHGNEHVGTATHCYAQLRNATDYYAQLHNAANCYAQLREATQQLRPATQQLRNSYATATRSYAQLHTATAAIAAQFPPEADSRVLAPSFLRSLTPLAGWERMLCSCLPGMLFGWLTWRLWSSLSETWLGHFHRWYMRKNLVSSTDGEALGYLCTTKATRIAQFTPPKQPNTLL